MTHSSQRFIFQHCGVDVDLNADTIMYEESDASVFSSRHNELQPSSTVSEHQQQAADPHTAGGDVALTASKSVEIAAKSQSRDDASSTSLLQEFLLVNFDVNNVKVTEVCFEATL